MVGVKSVLAVSIVVLSSIASQAQEVGLDSAVYGKQNGPMYLNEKRDTVFVERHCYSNQLPADNSKKRFKDCGLAGGPVSGVMALYSKPIKDVVEGSSFLKTKKFDFNEVNFEPVFINGGMGYFGFPNNVKIGGGGFSGDRYFESDEYNGDSVVVMKTTVQYGGFMVEKSFVFKRISLLTGIMIGSGSLKNEIRVARNENVSAFQIAHDADHVENMDTKFKVIQLQEGLIISATSFFHLGVEVGLPVFISEGFELYTDGFVSVNPNLRIRFMFGNVR